MKSSRKKHQPTEKVQADDRTRLNKYIANAGICSRREADELIRDGQVSVNGEVIREMGYKVGPGDKVSYNGKSLSAERHVYLLLNKPKDFITTVKDTHDRKTVMDLVGKACRERIYPVGRLDRGTTGLLLFTNDGDLAKKLTHPSHHIRKIYQVSLDKQVREEDLQTLTKGIELEDGTVRADKAVYVEGEKYSHKEVGIELHSGKNRVVRRMFEHLGYKVLRLDRVLFAELTKKDLPRGKWRFLSKTEVSILKRMSSK